MQLKVNRWNTKKRSFHFKKKLYFRFYLDSSRRVEWAGQGPTLSNINFTWKPWKVDNERIRNRTEISASQLVCPYKSKPLMGQHNLFKTVISAQLWFKDALWQRNSFLDERRRYRKEWNRYSIENIVLPWKLLFVELHKHCQTWKVTRKRNNRSAIYFLCK